MIKGIITFNVDVGQLPPDKAEERVKKVQQDHDELIKQLKEQHYGISFMMNRNGNNSIGKLPLD